MAEETPRLYLTDVHLKGYKSIKDTQATFNEGINIIIGPNGSGKTNFLEFLEKATNRYSLPDVHTLHLRYNMVYKTIGKSDTIGVEISYKRNYDEFIAKQDLGSLGKIEAKSTLYFNESKIDSINIKDLSGVNEIKSNLYSQGGRLKGLEIAIKKEYDLDPASVKLSYFRFALPEYLKMLNTSISLKAQLISLPLKEENKKKKDLILINSDSNYILKLLSSAFLLASMRGDLKNNYNEFVCDTFDVIVKENAIKWLSLFTPIKNIKLNNTFKVKSVDKDVSIDNIQIEFFLNDEWLSWSQLSDGIRRVTSLFFEILNNPKGPILLEEPELGLYPDQLQKLLTFIKEQSSRLQFIITTHSPDVLDILGIDELDKINICEMKGEEGTKIRKMTDEERTAVKAYHDEFGVLSDYWRYENFGLAK